MNWTSKAGFIAAAAALATGTAQARQPAKSWYFSGAATGSLLNKPRQTIANAPAPGSTLRIENDVRFGGGGMLAFGRSFGRLRAEVELGRTANHSDAYTAISPLSITLPQNGRNDVTRYMLNVYFDLAQGPVRPYLGAGAGAAHARVSTFAAPARAPAAPPSQLIDDSETDFAYQLIAGVAVPVTPRLALTVQYRWLDVGVVAGRDSRGERFTRAIAGHNFDVGFRFGF
jgi:opacity protein-like surface antigen